MIINVKAASHVRARDKSRAHAVSTSIPFEMTVFCLSAFDTAGLFLKFGPDFFAGTFNIGYWPWELDSFPQVWAEAFDLVDEVWASTRFQWRAYQTINRVPAYLMPPAVLIPPIRDLRRAAPVRRELRRFRFIFPFDPNSFIARKNPVAAIRAFRLAFPVGDRSVELVLRVNGRPNNFADGARFERPRGATPELK